MSGRRCFHKLVMGLLGACALALNASAQEPQQPQEPEPPAQATPKPAARGIPTLDDPNATVENQEPTQNWQPDNGPATGMQVASIGSPELAHNYWVPGLEYGSTIQSRPFGGTNSNGWYANNYIGGSISLLEAWGHSRLGLNYGGGGFFSTDSQIGSGAYQQLATGYALNLSRMQVQVFDYLSYLPDSQFGFAAGTGLALPGIGGSLGPSIPGLGTAIVPTQSIYAASGPRLSNAFAAQSTYSLSRRSSLTFGGSYGILHFTQSGNVDSDMVIGTAGYNYAVNKTDSIGVLYRFSAFHYVGQPQALGNHVANVVYVKKISQRLALSLFGGPQITTYRVPIGNSSQSVSGSGGVTFAYAMPHGMVSANYFHGLTNGGGVLIGSNADQAMAGFSHLIGRVWGANFHFGYSRNNSLQTVSGLPTHGYSDWFAGAGVNRPIGRNFDVAASYTVRYESVNTCAAASCNSTTQNMISLSLQWHTRPFVLP